VTINSSQFPRHRRAQSRGCWWVAWYLLNWYSHASDMLHIFEWNPLYLHTWLAKRIHFARFLHECEMPHNVLYGDKGHHLMILMPSSTSTHLLSKPLEQTLKRYSGSHVEMTFVDESPFVLPWWYITCNHKINNIRVLGVWSGDLKEHVIPQRIIDTQLLRILKLHSRQVIGNRIFYSLFIFYF
jgi:hypothetical protein